MALRASIVPSSTTTATVRLIAPTLSRRTSGSPGGCEPARPLFRDGELFSRDSPHGNHVQLVLAPKDALYLGLEMVAVAVKATGPSVAEWEPGQ